MADESALVKSLNQIKPAEQRVVRTVKDHARFGPAYFVQTGYGRFALVVHDGVKLRRAFAVNGATWRGLQRHALVTYGDSVEIEFSRRERHDGRWGEPITLTENGKAL